jgi:hypothetical protein
MGGTPAAAPTPRGSRRKCRSTRSFRTSVLQQRQPRLRLPSAPVALVHPTRVPWAERPPPRPQNETAPSVPTSAVFTGAPRSAISARSSPTMTPLAPPAVRISALPAAGWEDAGGRGRDRSLSLRLEACLPSRLHGHCALHVFCYCAGGGASALAEGPLMIVQPRLFPAWRSRWRVFIDYIGRACFESIRKSQICRLRAAPIPDHDGIAAPARKFFAHGPV